MSGRKVEDKGHVEKENVRAESKIQYYWGGNRAKLNNIQCRIIEVEGENNQSKEEAKRSGLLSRSKLRKTQGRSIQRLTIRRRGIARKNKGGQT